MKHTTKQTGNSRNRALMRRAAQLGCGISVIAMSAMLAARPARADGPANPASALSNAVPADSSSGGFVTAGSAQQNTGVAITSLVNDASGNNTVTNTGEGLFPGAATVTGNELAAFATGSAQTNTVDLATIGTSEAVTGISVLADQANIYYTYTDGEDTYYTPATINSTVFDSDLANDTTNATSGDTLTDLNNLITAQTTGNVANSSVNGVVPTSYSAAEPGSADAESGSGSASGNVVVATSQTNTALDGGVGSYATAGEEDADNYIGVSVDTSGDGGPQDLALSTDVSGNGISSVYLANSANNDIGVALTSGMETGAATLDGSLVIANQQTTTDSGYGGGTISGSGAVTNHNYIGPEIYGGDEDPVINLVDGSVTVDNNYVSSSAVNNSAVGAAGGPGNEITLGINLAGATTGEDFSNSISPDGDLSTVADLALSNQQTEAGQPISSLTQYAETYADVQGISGSTVGLSNNAISSNALGNDASNAVDTASGAGIDLISGLAALTSQQNASVSSGATTDYVGTGIYGDYAVMSMTNVSESITNDKITTNAGVNLVTNAVSLSSSTIDAGALGAAGGPVFGLGLIFASGDAVASGSVADAGISLNNEQNATPGAAPSAVQYSTDIAMYPETSAISNSSFVVTNPLFSATATTNSAANSIAANASQGISGSIGLVNTQAQSDGNATATLTEEDDGFGNDAVIALEAEGEDTGITGTSALLTGTNLAAEATENYADNALAATGGTLSNAADETIGLAAQLSIINEEAQPVSAQNLSDLALINVQDNYDGEAQADSYDTEAFIDADASDAPVSGSSFTVSGPAGNTPTSEALAIGNEALNGLSAIADTLLTDTAGLVNAQANDQGAEATLENSYAGVQVNSTPDYEPYINGDDGGNVSDTSITVGTGAAGGSNAIIMRALAYDNQATNQLSVSAETVAPSIASAIDGSQIYNDPPYDTSLSSDYAIGAAYSVLNDMYDYENDPTVTAQGLEIGAQLGNNDTNPAITDVTASTAGNAIIASLFSNQANNSAMISAGNLAAESYYPVADVTNLQTSLVDAASSITDYEGESFTTQNDGNGDISNSTFGVTDNTALSQVEGNQASNSLDTEGGNITDVADASQGLYGYGYFEGEDEANAAFSVQNVQSSNSYIGPEQEGTGALISTLGDVDLSTLTGDGNAFQSTGIANDAANNLSFGGTSPVDFLDSSAGLQNVQYGNDDVNVSLGAPGTLASSGTPDTTLGAVPYTVAPGEYNVAYENDGGTELVVTGEPIVFDMSSLSPTEQSDFESVFSNEGSASGNYYTLTAGTYALGDSGLFTLEGSTTYVYLGANENTLEDSTNPYTLDDGTPATPAIPASPSVLITAAGNITASTLDVSNNAFDAKAVDNHAVNTESITATTVNGGGAIPPGDASGTLSEEEALAEADYALSNIQTGESGVFSAAFGEAGINPTNSSTITGSTLMVSDNTQLATAEGNVASNTLSEAATNTASTPPTFALVSSQSNDDTVAAEAGILSDPYAPGLTITAPGAITDSTLTMDHNSSEALAAANDATNLLSASATNLDTADTSLTDAVADDDEEGNDSVYSTADYSLTNLQDGGNESVSATDVLQVENADSGSISTTGLVNSSVDISGNTAAAFAEVNTASNTLDMSAANTTATGALTNVQYAEDGVSATGSANVQFALNGSTDPDPAAATNSAINVSNNSLQVQGIGNQATNALNVATGASYGAQANGLASPNEAQATYAVLNVQDNEGPVSATVPTGTVFGVALNGGGSETPVSNTTVTVSYNVVDAKAFGNSATNSMTVAALNSGNATAALQNTQTNEGAVTANITGVGIGSNIGGPGVSNAGVAVGNNSVVASAVGNAATNSIVH